MKCPFTNKPCLLPKEIFITEPNADKNQQIALCKLCGDEYISQCNRDNNNVEVTSKVIEIKNTAQGVTYEEHILDDAKKEKSVDLASADKAAEATDEQDSTEIVEKLPLGSDEIELKLTDAINREDYESAAVLRDLLQSFKKEEEFVNDDKPVDETSSEN